MRHILCSFIEETSFLPGHIPWKFQIKFIQYTKYKKEHHSTMEIFVRILKFCADLKHLMGIWNKEGTEMTACEFAMIPHDGRGGGDEGC